MKTQTIKQAHRAIEAAGHKVLNGRVYDPRIRGSYLTIESGFCDAEYSDYCDIECESRKKGGPTGAHKDEIRSILTADRQGR